VPRIVTLILVGILIGAVPGCDEEPAPAGNKSTSQPPTALDRTIQQHLDRLEARQREWLAAHDSNLVWVPIVTTIGQFVVVSLLLAFSYRLVGALRPAPPEEAIAELITSELAVDQATDSPTAEDERPKWPW